MTVESWVETHISAAHAPEDGGPLHGHTWKIRATWLYGGESAVDLKAKLERVCRELDHTLLPARLSRAESIAVYLGDLLRAKRIDVWREADGMGATWTA